MLTYYQRNREKKLAYQATRYRSKKSEILLKSKIREQQYPDEARARWRRYRRRHPNRVREWIASNQDRHRETRRRYGLDNRETIKVARSLGVTMKEARTLLLRQRDDLTRVRAATPRPTRPRPTRYHSTFELTP